MKARGKEAQFSAPSAPERSLAQHTPRIRVRGERPRRGSTAACRDGEVQKERQEEGQPGREPDVRAAVADVADGEPADRGGEGSGGRQQRRRRGTITRARPRGREAAKPPLPTRSDTPFPLGSAPGSMPRPHILGPRRSRTSLKMRGWDALPRTWRSCVLVIVPLRASLCGRTRQQRRRLCLTRSARP